MSTPEDRRARVVEARHWGARSVEEALHALADDVEELERELAAVRSERNRLATDLGVRANLLEQVADGLVSPTRDAIQQRHDEMYEIIRRGGSE